MNWSENQSNFLDWNEPADDQFKDTGFSADVKRFSVKVTKPKPEDDLASIPSRE